jgi:hypothetical protein
MPLKIFKRKTKDGKFVYHFRGTVAGRRLRGTTGTADRKAALEVAAQVEHRNYKGRSIKAEGSLTFPAAVTLYLKAGKSDQYLDKIEDYWRNIKVKEMTAGAIRQSAIDLYPGCSGATELFRAASQRGCRGGHQQNAGKRRVSSRALSGGESAAGSAATWRQGIRVHNRADVHG